MYKGYTFIGHVKIEHKFLKKIPGYSATTHQKKEKYCGSGLNTAGTLRAVVYSVFLDQSLEQ